MLELRGVRAGYGKAPVLQGVDLLVAEGEIAAVLGRNGAGKTTLLRTVMGIVPLEAGSISFDGEDLGLLQPYERARRGIAYVPQGRLIFPTLTVLDNLRVAGYGTGRRDVDERAEEFLEEFPALQARRGGLGGSLSGGEQQMLALARALMMDPHLLLLDEPSEGIQPSIVDQIAERIASLNEEHGITVLLVEQNLEFASRVAGHAFIMNKGQVIRGLAAGEILQDTELQREYMGV